MADGASSIFVVGAGKTQADDFASARALLHVKIGQQAGEEG